MKLESFDVVGPYPTNPMSSYLSFPPHHWLAVTGDGVSFRALERRDARLRQSTWMRSMRIPKRRAGYCTSHRMRS